VRTPLTYYGGKQRLAREIVALMPTHRVYFEPFAGGAAVLFAKPRAERETLNDVDGRVMRFWRALRDRPDELVRAIAGTPYSRSEWEACKAEPDAEDDVEAARRFLVHTDQSFSREGTGWSPPSILFDRRGRWQAGVWQNLPDKLAAAATGSRGSRSRTATRST
jgi:DNA adenine methylase